MHPQAHGEYEYSLARLVSFAESALSQNLSELGLADHDNLGRRIDVGLVSELAKLYPSLNIRLGLEVDFFPGCERGVMEQLQTIPCDYVLGSVHNVDGFSFDIWENRRQYGIWEADALYRRYYQLLTQAIKSRLFDILAHLDVIKVFGCRPSGDQSEMALPALRSIKQAGLVAEINTNGRYKPVGEPYPSEQILQNCFHLGIPITFGSDAHEPELVGRDLSLARSLAWRVGYRQLAVFRRRQRFLLPL